jgi:phage head maturation protease
MEKLNKIAENAPNTDRRTVSQPMQVETVGENDTKQTEIEGYAAVFNERANIGGMFEEVIVPGAFDGVLTNDVRALYNHDNSKVLARTSSER